MDRISNVGLDYKELTYNNRNDNVLNTLPTIKDDVNNLNPSKVQNKKLKEVTECETCKNRRYQDVSNDPGVSFKSPTKVSPSQAASAVMSHEREHAGREASKASSEGKEATSTIRIFTSVCPECGKTYVSGGETRTTVTTKSKKEQPQNESSVDLKI